MCALPLSSVWVSEGDHTGNHVCVNGVTASLMAWHGLCLIGRCMVGDKLPQQPGGAQVGQRGYARQPP